MFDDFNNDIQNREKTAFLETTVPKKILILDIVLIILYFVVLTFLLPKGNWFLFSLLIAGEVFHTWQALTFVYTIWNTEYKQVFRAKFNKSVDVFITVAGEPTEIVEETVRAAMSMEYPRFTVNILNDGLVANKPNWQEMEKLAEKYGIKCITRTKPGGAKAGNINHALKHTGSKFVAVFDADHVPHKDFLQKTMGYFGNPKMAFVQSPQYYKNFGTNYIAKAAWEQQKLFFGPICKGKNRLNSTFMCGTNMVLRRSVLEEVGGMCEDNIAEDFLTSLFIHEKGYSSTYVPEVLSEGLAPEDFLSYYKQQYRWARGSLEVIFRFNPLFSKNLTWQQKTQYLASASYYLSGIVVLIDAMFPLIFFFSGLVPLASSTMLLAGVFLPYIFINLYTLQLASNFTYTFEALAFSVSSFYIHIRAIYSIFTGEKVKFSVTSKTQVQGNFVNYVIPQLSYIILAVVAVSFYFLRSSIDASFFTNFSWTILNVFVFSPFISASIPNIDIGAIYKDVISKLAIQKTDIDLNS